MKARDDASLIHVRPEHARVLHNQHSLEETVQSAERVFVLKEYKEALKFSIQALSFAEKDPPSLKNQSDCVCLTTPLDTQPEVMNGSFVVKMTTDISLLDRAAVVALQASHELSSTVGRQAFVKYYSQHAMPLEVAILWIQLVFRTNEVIPVELAAELLHHARKYPSLSVEVSDELVCLLVTEMLPFASSIDDVHNVLDRIQAISSWVSSSHAYSQAQDVNKEAVSLLLSRLDSFSSDPSLRDRCQRQLESLAFVEEAENDNHDGTFEYTTNLVESQPSQTNTIWKYPMTNSKEWHTTWAKRVLDFCRLYIVQPLFRDQDRWENRRRVAISALLVYFAWKRRRRLMLLTSSTATLISSPFREIMDAVLPSKRR